MNLYGDLTNQKMQKIEPVIIWHERGPIILCFAHFLDFDERNICFEKKYELIVRK